MFLEIYKQEPLVLGCVCVFYGHNKGEPGDGGALVLIASRSCVILISKLILAILILIVEKTTLVMMTMMTLR